MCGCEALKDLDPRMPLLRIPSCGQCRDLIAYARGWCRGPKFKREKLTFRVWRRNAGEIAEVLA